MRTGTLRADLGYFRRPEAARKGELNFVGYFLIAQDQDGMFLECRARRRICGVVRGDIRKRHAAQFGGKSWTQRHDVHRQVLPCYYCGQLYGRTARPATTRSGSGQTQRSRRMAACASRPRDEAIDDAPRVHRPAGWLTIERGCSPSGLGVMHMRRREFVGVLGAPRRQRFGRAPVGRSRHRPGFFASDSWVCPPPTVYPNAPKSFARACAISVIRKDGMSYGADRRQL